MAIKLYKHNKETYENILKMFKTKKRVAIVQPTGTGKSFLFLKWIEDYPESNFLILSSSSEIFAQLQNYVNRTSDQHILKNVDMKTYQALYFTTQDDIKSIHYDKIILDEFHRSGAEKWSISLNTLLEANPNAHILGSTATPIRYLDNCKDMVNELFYKNLATYMTLGEAIARKILPNPIYIPVWYEGSELAQKYNKNLSDLLKENENIYYEKRLKKLKETLEYSYGASAIFEKYMLTNHGKYIVFCKNVEHLYKMIPSVTNWLYKINQNIHSYTSINEDAKRTIQLKNFRDDDDENAIKLLFTIDRLNEGIHIPNIDGIIMLRPTTSPIIYLQQMGRALANNCKSPLIFDMVNNYQNVQIHLKDGNYKNILEKELEDVHKIMPTNYVFPIFDNVIPYRDIVQEYESILYTNNNESWKNHYNIYVKYKQQYRREPTKFDTYNNIQIGTWVIRQRAAYYMEELSEKQIELLVEAHFDFTTRNVKLEKQWLKMFQLYKEFKMNYDREPKKSEQYKGIRIGAWCHRQKTLYHKGELKEQRYIMLKEDDFDFETRYNKAEQRWLIILKLYKEFKEIYNREPVRSEQYKGVYLGQWATNQKTAYASDMLSNYQISLLKMEDFPFSVKDIHKIWFDNCLLYKEFKETYNREPSNDEVYKNVYIGRWAINQRSLYNKKKLPKDREEMLRESKFVFQKQMDIQWGEKFSLYREFKTIHKREPTQKEIYKDTNIGDWCSKQKQQYKAHKLPLQREALLRELKFPFPVSNT